MLVKNLNDLREEYHDFIDYIFDSMILVCRMYDPANPEEAFDGMEKQFRAKHAATNSHWFNLLSNLYTFRANTCRQLASGNIEFLVMRFTMNSITEKE